MLLKHNFGANMSAFICYIIGCLEYLVPEPIWAAACCILENLSYGLWFLISARFSVISVIRVSFAWLDLHKTIINTSNSYVMV